MKPYTALLRVRFLTLLQYRNAAMAGVVTQLFWGLIRTMIFEAFYASSTVRQPLTKGQLVTYIWLGQALLGLLPWSTDTELRDRMRSGAVVYDLLRPVDLYSHWYCSAIAARTAPTVLKSIPIFLIAGVFFGLSAPASPQAALAWVALTFCALLLNCAFSVLISTSMLWTVSGEGISRLAPTVVYALSGMMVPLVFFPAWLQPALNILPFRSMVDIPFRIYSGAIPATMALNYAIYTLSWAASLIVAGRVCLSRGMRRMVVQGG